MERLLLDDRIIAVQPGLVRALDGKAAQAIVLQQLHYWLPHARAEHDGHRWVYNTYEEWADQTGLSPPQVKRAMQSLVERGLVISAQPAGADRTRWYRIDYEHPLLAGDGMVPRNRSSGPVQETKPSDDSGYTETTQESTQDSSPAVAVVDEVPRHERDPEDVWPPEVIDTTRKVAAMIRQAGHALPKAKTKTADRWYDSIDKLLRLGPPGDTGDDPPPTPDEVLEVARWALLVSDFWPANVRSAAKIRDSWTQLRGQAKRSQNGRRAQTSDTAYADVFTRLAEREGQS